MFSSETRGVSLGLLEWDIWNGTSGMGHREWDIGNGTPGMGHLERDTWNGTSGTGHLEWDLVERDPLLVSYPMCAFNTINFLQRIFADAELLQIAMTMRTIQRAIWRILPRSTSRKS